MLGNPRGGIPSASDLQRARRLIQSKGGHVFSQICKHLAFLNNLTFFNVESQHGFHALREKVDLVQGVGIGDCFHKLLHVSNQDRSGTDQNGGGF